MSDIQDKREHVFLGLVNLPANHKAALFELVYYYQFIFKYLVYERGLKFDERKMSGVVGTLAERNDYIDEACYLARLIISGKFDEQLDFFENFDFSSLNKLVSEMKKVAGEINSGKDLNWLLRAFIWLRFSDWRSNLFVFARWFLSVFLFFSILYFLVTNDLGRQIAWDFLDVYGVVVRFLMMLLLIVAAVLIVGIVSFMYFEGKKNRE